MTNATYKCPVCGERHPFTTRDDALTCPNAGKKPKKHKFNAKKTEVDGIRFDSKGEAGRYEILKMAQEAGEISCLKCQPAFPIYVLDKKVTTYKADFAYYDAKNVLHVEDVKGMKTPVYNLKKKLLMAQSGLEIYEVKRPTDPIPQS